MQTTLYSCQILIKLELSPHAFKKWSNVNFTNICLVKAELFHADGQVDMMKLTVPFHNFLNVSKHH
jgi:hypothetical protein